MDLIQQNHNMKKFKLTQGDAYDLSMVMSMVIKEQSNKLTFKEILRLQKFVNYTLKEITDFSSKIDKINEEKAVFVENANKKIVKYREELQKSLPKDAESAEKLNTSVQEFVQTILKEAEIGVEGEINPKVESLYTVEGKVEKEFEVEEESHKVLVDAFELYAKEKYNNKNRMIEVYETLTSAE